MQDVDMEVMILIQYPVCYCIESSWDGINFPHSPHIAVCIGSWRGVNDTPGFWLLINSAHIAPRLSLQHSCLNQQPGSEHYLGRRHSQHTWPKWTKGMFQSSWLHSYIKIKRKEKEGGELFIVASICLSEQLLYTPKPCFSGRGWIWPDHEKRTNILLSYASMHKHLLLLC